MHNPYTGRILNGKTFLISKLLVSWKENVDALMKHFTFIFLENI